MKELIEALTILLKYGNPGNPTHCEHDVLTICGIDHRIVSEEDKKELSRLGINVGDPHGIGDTHFYSFKYGSA